MAENRSGFGERTEAWFQGDRGATLQPIEVTGATVAWLQAMEANGLFVTDSLGDRTLAPKLREVLRALHTVLAKGEVRISIDMPPDDAAKRDMDKKLDAAIASLAVPAPR